MLNYLLSATIMETEIHRTSEENFMAKGMEKKKETKKKAQKTQKEKRADKAAKKG